MWRAQALTRSKPGRCEGRGRGVEQRSRGRSGLIQTGVAGRRWADQIGVDWPDGETLQKDAPSWWESAALAN